MENLTGGTYEIKKIYESDYDECLELFIDCFKDDLYIAMMLPKESTRAAIMIKEFGQNIRYCARNDGLYGAYDNNRIIAFIAFCNYQKLKQTDSSRLERMFKGESKKIIFPHEKELFSRIDCLGGRVIYLLSMGVNKDYRNKGIAGSLIDFMMKSFPNDYLVGEEQ